MQTTEHSRLILMLMSPFGSCYTSMALNWLAESVLIVQKLQLVAISREKKRFRVILCAISLRVSGLSLFLSRNKTLLKALTR